MNKIDIRDLRVGNLIYHKDCPIPLQVSGVKDGEVYLKHSFAHNRTVGFVRQDRPSMCNIDEIKPIPLTKEILEKNRFKECDRYWVYRDNSCSIKLNIAPKIEIDGEIIDEPPILLQVDGATFNLSIIIEYVHELQHALKLCGIEKEITI